MTKKEELLAGQAEMHRRLEENSNAAFEMYDEMLKSPTGRERRFQDYFKELSIAYINPSDFNNSNRDMNQEDLRILADSIAEYGIKEPLRVYQDKDKRDGYKYAILSGHRRFAAVQYINSHLDIYTERITKVPVQICDAPSDFLDERIDATISNIQRKKPKDLENEIKAAAEIWTEIVNSENYGKWKKKLRDSFIKRNEENESYINHPEEYLLNNYRPKLEFIRQMTGLDLSNKTIKSYLITNINADDTEEDLPKASKKKEPSPKSLNSKFKKLSKEADYLYDNYIMFYYPERDQEYQETLESIKNQIAHLLSLLVD